MPLARDANALALADLDGDFLLDLFVVAGKYSMTSSDNTLVLDVDGDGTADVAIATGVGGTPGGVRLERTTCLPRGRIPLSFSAPHD